MMTNTKNNSNIEYVTRDTCPPSATLPRSTYTNDAKRWETRLSSIESQPKKVVVLVVVVVIIVVVVVIIVVVVVFGFDPKT